MKTYKKNIKTIVLIAGLMMMSFSATATTQITFEDDVEDIPPPMPIDGLLGLGLAAGAYIGWRKRIKDVK